MCFVGCVSDGAARAAGAVVISELMDKVETHIYQYIVHNHKNQRNPAIDRHIVLFDLIEEKIVPEFPTLVFDQKRASTLLKLKL
jgi:hypothetical protein